MTRLGAATPWVGQLVPVNVDVWRPEGDTQLEPFSLDDVVISNGVISNLDWLPTLLAAAGVHDVTQKLLTGYKAPGGQGATKAHTACM